MGEYKPDPNYRPPTNAFMEHMKKYVRGNEQADVEKRRQQKLKEFSEMPLPPGFEVKKEADGSFTMPDGTNMKFNDEHMFSEAALPKAMFFGVPPDSKPMEQYTEWSYEHQQDIIYFKASWNLEPVPGCPIGMYPDTSQCNMGNKYELLDHTQSDLVKQWRRIMWTSIKISGLAVDHPETTPHNSDDLGSVVSDESETWRFLLSLYEVGNPDAMWSCPVWATLVVLMANSRAKQINYNVHRMTNKLDGSNPEHADLEAQYQSHPWKIPIYSLDMMDPERPKPRMPSFSAAAAMQMYNSSFMPKYEMAAEEEEEEEAKPPTTEAEPNPKLTDSAIREVIRDIVKKGLFPEMPRDSPKK